EEFKKLTHRGNLIPVYRELLADMETPVSVFHRFADDDYAFLLESVEGGEQWGRYSIIGVNPKAIFTVENGAARLVGKDGQVKTLAEGEKDLFRSLQQELAEVQPVKLPGLPRFMGGAVGYIGYETVCEFEDLPPPKTPLDKPVTAMMLTEDLIVFDNVRHTLKLTACAHLSDFETPEAAYRDACARIERLEEQLQKKPMLAVWDNTGGREDNHSSSKPQVEIKSNLDKATFCRMVEKTKDYITRGDTIQTVLSQRFHTELRAEPFAVYRALRLINPSPYMYFLKFADNILAGSSPEIMVRLTDNRLELRPIAGTRPRGRTEQEDNELADSLLGDEKERAEHVMLVDLGRNDLGRVAVPGSVQVRDFMTIERYSHVMHIVSEIQAELEKGKNAFDAVQATFPAGTLTGAPKIRAMEIINELEPSPRGAYGGAVGYIGYDGNMDLAITIRTLEILRGQVAVQAGAGIVADSVPETEYEETVNKARGMVTALEMAAANLKIRDLA
ncbi:MAG: anthranilate synthase component I, partial [Verrucomicrobiota bacterium]